ncbi:MAG TPA: hypothetical protein VMI10_13490 [Terriglobales bacterium]|nr:hypothetical protein [Terriglobales bacterium]
MQSFLFSSGYCWFRKLFVVALLISSPVAICAPTSTPAKPAAQQPMAPKTREEILHAFNAELVYIRTNFPMGKTGLKIKDGAVTPSGADLQQLMAMWGPAVKPGDQARISDVIIKPNYIRFEINGGPVKKQKWYQHIQIQGSQPTSITPGGETQPGNPRGSYVDLCFDKFVPEMTGPELKDLLWPVFDFDSKTPLEAYLESVPPKVKEAIQNHHVLVGMNQQMVIYAKGRPPKRIREQDGDTSYEEWIFGVPPEDVDFVRFVGDEVIRVETMKVDGQKVVRVEKEVNLDDQTVASRKEHPAGSAPTLRRPGEDMPDTPRQNPAPTPVYAPTPTPGPPGGDPGPNWLPTSLR